ncbi:hypothetical protein CKM354_000832900 [Cercospora kikuchii]|uniref:Uncharacterized protein n=1 Tax=Cercospora kikuchii TaxID=84275 RepID=A0A9P3CVN7_9PEZI|nr:uncharacterized protein CKM354_000832900 [Cercospora kikuchii]GIZ45148.1 hypothetical protein CKM354_000832900 [Cercospora kikuchii]
MSDATEQFLSHLGKCLCDLANNRPTESSRGWLRQLAEKHSYSALPWVRDGVEQIEREMLHLRKPVHQNGKATDTQTIVDLKIAIYDERQQHQAAIAKLEEALRKRQLVDDEATTGTTEEVIDKSQAQSAECQNHEADIRLLLEELEAADSARKALQIEHDAVLEDLHDAKERRTAALHYTDQLQSILGVNLQAWHDSDSVAEDSVNGSNEDAAPAGHCRSLSSTPSSPQVVVPSTHDIRTHNSPPSPEQPNRSQQDLHPLNRREQDCLQRIYDLETENEKLREELQLSEQLQADTDADLTDILEEPLQGSDEVVKSPRQVVERLHEEVITAQQAMTSDESGDGSDQEEGVEAGWNAWRAPRVTETLERALHLLNDWHRSHFHVMH